VRTLTVTKTGPGTGTVTSSPSGINCGATCAATFSDGTSVTLTATPSSRSRFTGWSGDCSGRSTCVLSMTANHSATANFAKPLTPPHCVVPNVVGLTVGKAKSKIARAHCRVGKVTLSASTRAKKGKVLAQTPVAHRRLRNGAKINLTVGKGPKRK
jgi:hypothetical protein